MYFESRAEAGQKLALQLYDQYRYEDCAVIALSDGAVPVAEQIAVMLHCFMTMLLVEDIDIPGEDITIGGVTQTGGFTYNGMLSAGQIEGYVGEFHGYFEERKREAFQQINRLLGDGGLIDNEMLRDRNIILVADGLDNGVSIDVAMDFLKPIRTQRIIIATPVASVPAVDKIHVQADEIHVLSVKENYMGTDHYYEQNDIPSHDETIQKINQIVLNWR